jgi:hypothetical protein
VIVVLNVNGLNIGDLEVRLVLSPRLGKKVQKFFKVMGWDQNIFFSGKQENRNLSETILEGLHLIERTQQFPVNFQVTMWAIVILSNAAASHHLSPMHHVLSGRATDIIIGHHRYPSQINMKAIIKPSEALAHCPGYVWEVPG